MTKRQQDFADCYLESGNATFAAKQAGYSEKTAYSQGQRMLKNTEISKYIAEKLDEMSAKRIASADETLAFYTSVMRGQACDQFGVGASFSDRLKAGDALMKRWNASGKFSSKTGMVDDPLSAALKEEARRMERNFDQEEKDLE